MSGESVNPGGPNSGRPASRRTAIVTGGTRGIGLEVARRLASDGANVVVAGTSATAGAAARHLVAAEAQGEVLFRQTDVGDAADAAGLVEWTVQQFSSLDVLVNSAGVNVREGPLGPSEEQWQALFRTNAAGCWWCTRSALPHLLATRGAIVNLASVSGLVGSAGMVGYAASKGAVIALSRSLALAHAASGLRVNVVCPGPIETEMTRASWGTLGEEEGRRRAEAMSPAARLGQVAEVAAVVCFLAGPEASYVNGAVIPVDGAKSAGIMKADRYQLP